MRAVRSGAICGCCRLCLSAEASQSASFTHRPSLSVICWWEVAASCKTFSASLPSLSEKAFKNVSVNSSCRHRCSFPTRWLNLPMSCNNPANPTDQPLPPILTTFSKEAMVEAAGIEPASEKAATSVPTGVAAAFPLGSRPPSGKRSVAQPAFLFASA